MLLDKTVSFHAAHDPARVNDPAVLRERAKVQLIPDEEMERNFYRRREAAVEIMLERWNQAKRAGDGCARHYPEPDDASRRLSPRLAT